MSISDCWLLLSFILEGVKAVQKFISDSEVRKAFKDLPNAKTDDEKEAVAKSVATLLYNKPY